MGRNKRRILTILIVLAVLAAVVGGVGYYKLFRELPQQLASDPRFTGANVVEQIEQVTHLSALDRLLYQFLIIPQVRRTLLQSKTNFEWTDQRVDWGRGRIDPFNPIKFGILRREAYGNGRINEIDDHTIGNSDMQPIWNLKARVEHKMAYHWD